LCFAVVAIALLSGARSATAQSVVACRDRSGAIVECADDSGGGGGYNTGVCNVICQGIRDLLGIPNSTAPSGPSPAQIEAARRAQIEANQQRQLEQQRASEARFAAERDAAAQGLKGVAGGSGLKGGDGAALHQLPSTTLTSTAASHFDNEPAKALSNCGFDNALGCATATPVTVPKISGAKPPGVAALWDRLGPDAQKDPEIRQNVALLTKLENRKTEKQQQLADLKKEIGQGGGDASVLAAKKGTLENDLTQIDKDEQTAADQIGKRMADRHLSWNEGK
jgi:hypothetical protein